MAILKECADCGSTEYCECGSEPFWQWVQFDDMHFIGCYCGKGIYNVPLNITEGNHDHLRLAARTVAKLKAHAAAKLLNHKELLDRIFPD